MSQYVRVGMGAETSILGSVKPTPEGCQKMGMAYNPSTGQCVKAVATAPAPATNWGGLVQTGLQTISSVFGKQPAQAPVSYQEPTNYLPWILGGAAVLGAVFFLTRRKKGK